MRTVSDHARAAAVARQLSDGERFEHFAQQLRHLLAGTLRPGLDLARHAVQMFEQAFRGDALVRHHPVEQPLTQARIRTQRDEQRQRQ
jgi:hypothetical protein